MANETTEISGIVKKCKILLLDIEGTTTSISFVKDKLFPYAEENVKQFLENQWEDEGVKEAVVALRKLALEDQEKSVEGAVQIPGEDATKEEQIEGLVKNVKWQMSADRKAGPLKLLQGLIWKQGYDNGEIKGHVYDDVSPALQQWRATEGQKVYIYSSGSVDAQKLLFGQSLAGDLLPFIDGHFDTAVGAKQEADSYKAIVEKIGCKAEEILFLTDIVKEAEAARSAGVHTALVSRAGNAALPADAAASFPVLSSLAQLAVSNKRKTDPQDEQPAKIAKTDTEVNAVEAEVSKEPVSDVPTVTSEEPEKTEKMDVEEVAPVEQPSSKNGEEKMEDSPIEKTVVEEITDAADIGDIPVISVEPVVIEDVDKTDEKQTEAMETEITETSTTVSELNGKNEEAVEDKPKVLITEIKEITDKQPIPEVAEVIDDLMPVVEEPSTVEDMEELQNVGESLEKECEEILSKVQDVTNLDKIPLKPLLNPIAEETMESENADSNDIVERILDTEIELGMKQCEDIDLNTVTEITEAGTKPVSDKTEQVDAISIDKVPEDKVLGEASEVKNSTEKLDGSCSTEQTTDFKERKPVEVEMKEIPEKSKESPEESKETPEESKVTPEESKVTPEESKVTPEESKAKPEESKETPVQCTEAIVETNGSVDANATTDKSEVITETKDNQSTEPGNAESEVKVNGNMTNGDSETANLNGDAKNEELNSRLSAENGKEVNGSNGNAKETEEKGQGDAKEMEVADIKVKTVAVEEQHTGPIEQPTEA